MKHVEQLVSIFLNVHEVMAFVWGPIKLALIAATVWADSIKQLLDAYEEIGEALSNLAFFHTLIKSNGAEHLRRALEDYFSGILRFHRCVLVVFSRPNWITFFKAAWGSFRRQVEPIIRALKLRQEKLSHERLQAHAIHQGVQDFRGHADDRFDRLEADLDRIRNAMASECLKRQTSVEDQDMKEFLEDKLNISRFGSRHRLDSPELSSPSAGDWIFQHPHFQAWERATSSQGNILFLNGSPGAGKTTLAMKVIRYLMGKDPIHGSTVHFLFRHDDDDRKSAKPMLRTILAQLIQQDETIMRYLYEKSAPMSSNLELSSLATLQDLTRECLTSQRSVSVYSKSRAAEICARFSQTPEQEEELATKVAKTSQGMFLYTKVVMSNFLSMDSVDEFEDEMQSGRFPENLYKAYERIIQRVLEKSKPSRQKTVKKILGWIICSQRPLRWREIQSRFCIDAEKGTCNPKRRRLDGCKDICSSLVDMVHETAGRYLVQRGIIDLLQEHTDLALFCCRYLSSRPFLQDPETDSTQDALQSGYFGFLDYATVNYCYHIEEAQKHVSGPPADVVSSVVGLLTAYSDNPSNQSIRKMEACAQTVTNMLRTQNIDARIQSRVIAIRAAGESQHRDLSKESAYLDLSGPLRFKCPRVFCPRFLTGFRSQDARDEHLDRHERPYRCTHTVCFLHDVGCESRERLEAHRKAFHQNSSKLAVSFPSTKSTKSRDISEACRKGNLGEVRQFHLSGEPLHRTWTGSYVTPLFVATRAGHAHICKYIIDQGIDPFKERHYMGRDWSSMLEAIRRANAPIVELFLHSQYEVTIARFPRYIAIAILAGHLEILELLLGSRTVLDHATIAEQVTNELRSISDVERWLKDPPADSSLVHVWFRRAFPNLYRDKISAPGASSLIKKPGSAEYRACKKVLQQYGSLLHEALQSKCHPLSMFLLDLADEDDLQGTANGGDQPIHRLARSGCGDRDCRNCAIIARRLIEIDGAVSVNTPDRDDYLPIHIALTSTFVPRSVILVLFLHTDNLNHRDPGGKRPTERVSRTGGAISVIVEACRLDSSIGNYQGRTIFSLAVGTYWIDERTLENLLEADSTLAWMADNTEDRQTPLHHAMRAARNNESQAEKAKLLLSLDEVEVENVLRAFSASRMGGNDEACREVRKFAYRWDLEWAVTIMDRRGFGL
ncbi:NACHT domain-containing protein [Fusarium sp. Ph1]|nr:NACHT domain-containing protein [Fusarium sp. Ph1]